nr:cysteine-rich CWC family protein [Bradyrhizobium jicamae]
MTNRTGSSSARRLACVNCGTEFGCDPQGGCWCAEEDFRVPMPSDGSDCLCPACLRALADQQKTVSVT